jgi:hypothetical protein
VLATVRVVVLSIAQQDGKTRMIVAKEKERSSVTAALVMLASAPETATPPFNSYAVTIPAAVFVIVPLKVT